MLCEIGRVLLWSRPVGAREGALERRLVALEREVAAVQARARCAHERCATEVLAALEHAVGEIACAA
jgi:hypothetical protein